MPLSYRRAMVAGLLALLLAVASALVVSADPPDPKQPLPPIPDAPIAPPITGKIDGPNGVHDFTELIAREDTWIASGPLYANQNRGGDQILYIGWDGRSDAQAERTLVYFNASVPDGAIVDSAFLSLTLFGSQGGGTMNIAARRISGGWRENEVTWNSTPAFDNGTDWAVSSVGTTLGRWQWDLTDLARRWINGDFQNQGVILIGDETTQPGVAFDRAFWSREAPNEGNRPSLVVSYGVARVVDFPANVGTSFPVRWDSGGATSISRWDVEYRRRPFNSSDWSGWIRWLDRYDSTSAHFNADSGFIYQFRVRGVYGNDVRTTWSAPSNETNTDTTPPTVQWTPPLPSFSPPAFTVAWVGSDTGSGVQNYDFEAYDNGQVFAVFTTTATSQAFSGGIDGHVYTFRVRARDNAGNVSEWITTATTVESNPPTVSINPLPAISPATFTVSWTGSDSGSGIDHYQLEIYKNGVGQATVQQPNSSYTLTNGENGATYMFRVRAVSRSGLISEWSQSVSTVVDAAPPTAIVNVAARYQTNTNIAVGWSATDSVSGVASYDLQVSLNGGAWVDWLTFVSFTNGAYFGTTGNTYAFRVRARDNAGNVSDWVTGFNNTTTITVAETRGRVLGNRGLPIPGATVSSVPSAINNNTQTGGGGSYALFWNAVAARTVNASHPRYLPFTAISLPAASGIQDNVDIYLRPGNDVMANGNFQANLTGWTTVGAVTLSGSSHSGASSARLVAGSSLTQRVHVPGGSNVVSYLYTVDGAASGALQVVFENFSDGRPAVTNIVQLLGVTGWRHAFIELDATYAGVEFDLRFTLSPTATGAVLLDEISLGAPQAMVYYQGLPLILKNGQLSAAGAGAGKEEDFVPMLSDPPSGPASDTGGAPVIDLSRPYGSQP